MVKSSRASFGLHIYCIALWVRKYLHWWLVKWQKDATSTCSSLLCITRLNTTWSDHGPSNIFNVYIGILHEGHFQTDSNPSPWGSKSNSLPTTLARTLWRTVYCSLASCSLKSSMTFIWGDRCTETNIIFLEWRHSKTVGQHCICLTSFAQLTYLRMKQW